MIMKRQKAIQKEFYSKFIRINPYENKFKKLKTKKNNNNNKY